MNIVFMGTPDFAVKILESLLKAGHNVTSVYTQPDRPKGRGHRLTPSTVKEYALGEGIPVYTPTSLKDGDVISNLTSETPDAIVVAAYGRILPKAVLSVPKYGCINVHASLLPKYRGAAPIQWAVINGESETGVTIMLMNEGLDTGDIILSESVKIESDDTAGTMFEKLADLGAGLINPALIGIADGSLIPTSQDDSKSTYAPMLTKQMAEIDWSGDAQKIHDLIRGLNPFYIAKTVCSGSVLKIHSTRCVSGVGKCGEVIDNGNRLVVACGNGTALELLTVQGENGKTMSAADYLRGHPIEKGTIFS